MLMEITIQVDVDGTYIPGSAPRAVGDGTWEPGEGGMMGDTVVRLGGLDITNLLDADTLDIAEDTWLENYESTL